MQWVFDKRSLFGEAASHLSLVSSGAEPSWRAATRSSPSWRCRRSARRCPRPAMPARARGRRAREASDVFGRARSAAASVDDHGRSRVVPRGRLDRHRPARYDRKRRAERPHGGRSGVDIRDWRFVNRDSEPTATQITNTNQASRITNDIHRRPLPGNRAQREEPAVVPRPPGTEPAERRSDLDVKNVRALMGRIEVVLGPTASRKKWASASAARSASRTSRTPGGTKLDIETIAAAILVDLGDRRAGAFVSRCAAPTSASR